MSRAIPTITAEQISDYAGGRLDAEEARAIEASAAHDEGIAAAVADARRINLRMNLWLATSILRSPDAKDDFARK